PRSRRAPRGTSTPPSRIGSRRMSFAEPPLSLGLVGQRGAAGLDDEEREGELPVSAFEGVGEFLPASVLDPPADRRISEEELDLPQRLERCNGRVAAQELDRARRL